MTTTSTTTAAQGYVSDPRNDDVLVWVNGDLVPKAQAMVSVFDAGFGFGDGVWEGLRLVRGRILTVIADQDGNTGVLCVDASAVMKD